MSKIVKYPFGKADERAIAFAAAMTVEIENQETALTVGQMTGAGTLNVNAEAEVETGAELVVKVSADGTNRVLTLGNGFMGNAVTITASKTFVLLFKFMGGKFHLISSNVLN